MKGRNLYLLFMFTYQNHCLWTCLPLSSLTPRLSSCQPHSYSSVMY